MLDYEQLVDSIQNFLSSADQTQTPDVEAWAADYVQWCRQTNDRLRHCQKYLQKGLRGEAVHLAEEHPSLLEVATVLDFPAVPEWREICMQYGFPAPPQLHMEYAHALNEAYAEGAPVEQLLAQHRLMGVARAPLADHLVVLRSLAAADPGTSFWEDDTREFERARLSEVRGDLARYVSEQNVDNLTRLHRELHDKKWRIEVPKDLLRAVDAAKQSVRGAVAEQMLRDLLPTLNTAYSAMNLADCRQVVNQWNEILSAAGMPAPAALEEQVRPVIEWIEQEDARERQGVEFENACDALQAALDKDAPDVELERTFRITTKFPLELPAALEAQYHRRVASRASAQRHRRILAVSSVAVVAVIGLTVTALLFWRANRTGQVETWQRMLVEARTSVVSEFRVDKAQRVRKTFVQDGAQQAKSPVLIKALADLDGAITQEERREGEFSTALKAAGEPDKVDPPTLDYLKGAAKSEQEKATVEALASQVESLHHSQQQDADSRFTKDATDLSAQMVKDLTPPPLPKDEAGFATKLADFRSRIEQFVGRSDVSKTLRESLTESLRSKINGYENAASRYKLEQLLLDKLAISGDGCATREAALNAYLKAIPDGQKAQDFRSALEALANDRMVEAWMVLSRGWGTAMLPANGQDAKQRTDDIQKYIEQYPKSPWVEQARAYKDYVLRATRANAQDGPWRQGMRDLLRHPMMQLYVLQTTSGRTFFVEESSALKQDSVGARVKAYADATLDRLGWQPLEKGESLTSNKPAASPQKLFAEDILTKIDRTSFGSWEDLAVTVVDELAAARNINPVLRGLVLSQVMELNKNALDSQFSENYTKAADQLTDLRLNNENWVDSKTASGDLADKVGKIIAGLPDVKAMRRDLQARRDALLRRVNGNLLGEGLVMRVAGQWRVCTATEAPEGTQALAIPTGSGLTSSAHGLNFVTVANRRSGEWILENNGVSGLPEGCGLFLRRAGE